VAALLALTLLLPLRPALARDKQQPAGTLAVINAGSTRYETVEQAARTLTTYLGGWATQPGISAYLYGRPNPGALPVGQTGEELVRLVERVRTERSASRGDLSALSRLLGVDYLLLLRVGGRTFQARLFSVRRGSYGPGTFEAEIDKQQSLKQYVVEQTRARGKLIIERPRWWMWVAAAGLAALTLTLVLTTGDDSSGDLRIRVTR